MLRRYLCLAATFLSLSSMLIGQNGNTEGAAAVYSSTTGSISASALWIDASQFVSGVGPVYDICLAIQAAIASVPVHGTAAGVVIDARNFILPSSSPFVIPCAANPFTVTGNPLVLVTGNTATNSPGAAGGIVLLPGATIATAAPWLVPQSWSVIGQGALATVIVPNSTFAPPPYALTTLASVSGVNVTGNSTTWPYPTTAPAGAILFDCGTTSCTASPTNAMVVGMVTDWTSATTLKLGTPAQTNFVSTTSYYEFMEPLMAWATTSLPLNNGALQSSTTGSVIQDIGLNCSLNGGAASAAVPGCLPFWDQYGQERSQLKRLRITNFGKDSSNPLGIGIYTSGSQNGGPFDDIQMATAAVQGTNICVEVAGLGLGVGGQAPMRGIRGLTCTGPAQTGGVGGTGVDINTQNFSLSDTHFENVTNGVNVGSLTSARGIYINNVTGGGYNTTAYPPYLVNINSYCATASTGNCQAFATSNINVSHVYQPCTTGLGTSCFALYDGTSGSGHGTSEATLGFYSLGDGNTTSGTSSRPVLTTSSSIGSTPFLSGMTTPPVTSVQGAGTLVQMTTGSGTGGDIVKFGSGGDTVNSKASDNGTLFFPGENIDLQANSVGSEATTAAGTYNPGDLACVTATSTVGSCSSAAANSSYVGTYSARTEHFPSMQ